MFRMFVVLLCGGCLVFSSTAEAGPIGRMLKEAFESMFGKFGSESGEAAAKKSGQVGRKGQLDADNEGSVDSFLFEEGLQEGLQQGGEEFFDRKDNDDLDLYRRRDGRY